MSLEPNCRSMAVYGMNGAGKSSFVDAVEYALGAGRIGHLAHEYSGKHQEKAVLNTHKPKDRKTGVGIKFKDGSELKIEIRQDGSTVSSGTGAGTIGAWNYRRTILRQDEVSAFIHDTKGGKYSALLPLLGLHEMDVAAENLRQLARTVENQSKLKETKAILGQVEARRKEVFGTDSDEQMLKKIEDLHGSYCADKAATKDGTSRCDELRTAVEARIAQFAADQRRHLALREVGELDLKGPVDTVRAAALKIAGVVEPLIEEKLEVLQSAGVFVGKLAGEGNVTCPACGRSIAVDLFQEHAKVEQERLQEIISTFNDRKLAMGILCDTVKSLKFNLGKADVKAWRNEVANVRLAEYFAFLDGLNAEALRTFCSEGDLKNIEGKLVPLVEAAALASRNGPAEVQQLATAKQIGEAGKAAIAAIDQAAITQRDEALVAVISSLERDIRKQIRLRSRKVIDDISADIQAMWAILHPGEAIENVRLYFAASADKAIDIGLKFFGVEQESPRLTLSEGYRNSLGLCIFLAMAKREEDNDRPLFLDDVVVSLDRNHRGMIVALLEKEFAGRQVIILTHDRDWYTELRQQLDEKSWVFKTLLPYESPVLGIRWSHKTTTFDDARAQLPERPDSAGNDARKIMDVELALIAERLQVRLPYLRGDKNDKRMAHDLLERFVADGKQCLQKRTAKGHEIDADRIEALNQADRLLVSWANRASHTFDVVRPEASKLIDACEKAVETFKCLSCGKGVWFADAADSEWVQCQCGELRWRYGKG